MQYTSNALNKFTGHDSRIGDAVEVYEKHFELFIGSCSRTRKKGFIHMCTI